MVPVGWYEAGSTGFSVAGTSLEAWVAIAFLGVACSFLATLLYFVALGLTESQKVGVYLYTIPPMTAVVAALYLGEVITVNLVIGAVLVIRRRTYRTGMMVPFVGQPSRLPGGW